MAVTFSHAHMFRCVTVAEKYMASGNLAPRFPYALMRWCLYTRTNTCISIHVLFIYLYTININGNNLLQWQDTNACCGIMVHIRRAGYKKSFKVQEFNSKRTFFFFHCGATALPWHRPPHCWGFEITHRHSTVGRTLVDEWSARRRDLCLTTQHSQETDIHAFGGIWTRNPSKRAAADLYFRQENRYRILLLFVVYLKYNADNISDYIASIERMVST
jgi:hypothetical protein